MKKQTSLKKKHPEEYWRILPDEMKLTLKRLFGDKL